MPIFSAHIFNLIIATITTNYQPSTSPIETVTCMPLEIFSSFDTLSIMKGFGLTLLILVVSIFYLDAFLPHPQPHHHWQRQTTKQSPAIKSSGRVIIHPDGSFKLQEKTSNDDAAPYSAASFSHADILWKVRPPPNTPRFQKLWLRFAANMIRLECKIKRQEPPLVLTPRTGQAVLEAYYRPSNTNSGISKKYVKIGRFGFTTERGPPAPPIQESVHDIYNLNTNTMVGTAAIIYMFVEPEYRKKDLGTLALQVISLIHAIQGCDFTVLVVDDNGSGKLIDWYELKGYSKAPKLQNMLGSPNAINGITMMAPTNRILPLGCHIQWW
jgi:GNAT superfamily N-acetyltransferase